MSQLRLNHNQFSGPLPAALSNASTLLTLELQNNPRLTGPLPDSFLTMDPLTFYFNNTSVCIPDEASFIGWLSDIHNLLDSGIFCTPTVAVSPSGGELTSYDGHVSISFPTGAFSVTTLVTYTQFIDLPTSDLAGVNRYFELQAAQGGAVITQTATPLTISVMYETGDPIISGTLQLYRLENEAWTDEAVTPISDESNILVGQAAYLTYYAVLGSTHRFYLPVIQAAFD